VPLPDIQSMRAHVQGQRVRLREGDYTPSARKLLAREGKARPDGSYPIDSAQDVEDAVDDFNRSDGSAEDRHHIVERAKAVGAKDKLPEGWSASTKALHESAGAGNLERLLGIPLLPAGSAAGPVRLREASAADLAQLEAKLGIPMLDGAPDATATGDGDLEKLLGIRFSTGTPSRRCASASWPRHSTASPCCPRRCAT
jgi:hypothetical protein